MNKKPPAMSKLSEKEKIDMVQKLDDATIDKNVKVYEGKVETVYACQFAGPVPTGEPYFKMTRQIYADHEKSASIRWGTGVVLPDLNQNEIDAFKQAFLGRCVDAAGGGKKGVFIAQNFTQESSPDHPQSKLAGWINKALPYAGAAFIAGVMVPCAYVTLSVLGGSQGFLVNSPNLFNTVLAASGASLGTGFLGGAVGEAILSKIDPAKSKPSNQKDEPLEFDKKRALDELRKSLGFPSAVASSKTQAMVKAKDLDSLPIGDRLANRRPEVDRSDMEMSAGLKSKQG